MLGRPDDPAARGPEALLRGWLLDFLDVAGDCYQVYAVGEVDEADAHGLAAGSADFAGVGSDDAAVGGDGVDLIIEAHRERTHEGAPLGDDLGGQDAFAAADLDGVVVDLGALGIAAVGGDQHIYAVGDDNHRQQLVAVGEPHPDHAGG